jgi:pimeloyl-ACP methyl ester carboxylesterase
MTSNTIVFIHGMYMTPLCWEEWIHHFEAKGFRCLAPAWPGREGAVRDLRTDHPDPHLGRITLGAVVEQYTRVIHELDETPILIGHSMGGLVAQLLRQRENVAAVIAIDSAPPPGVFSTKWSFIRSNWPHINPFVRKSLPIQMTLDQFRYTFVHTLPPEEQRAVFERYVVPESRRVPAASLTPAARIDYARTGSPLLFVAGSEDRIIPSSLNKSNYLKYRHAGTTVSFKEFAGRTHYIIGQEKWEEIADFVESWLREVGVSAASSSMNPAA